MKFQSDICQHCGQSTEYLITLDKGTAIMMIAIANAIEYKGENYIHPRKEMEVSGKFLGDAASLAKIGKMNSNSVGNLTKARANGLIARVKGEPGYYCITKKGHQFLSGQTVYKNAIRSKVYDKTVGYFIDEENTEKNTTNIRKLLSDSEYWEIYNK